MDQSEREPSPPPGASGLGRALLVASAEAIADAPALALSRHLCVGPNDPVATMRAAMQGNLPEWGDDMDTVVVVAACEPLLEPFRSGLVFRAVDYINTLGDSPQIGLSPTTSESFFLDMNNPFQTPAPLATSAAIRDAVLAGWQGQEGPDSSHCAWLRSLGAEIISTHGICEAIAARAAGKHCVALFYARGDRESTHALLDCLGEWGLCSIPSSENHS